MFMTKQNTFYTTILCFFIIGFTSCTKGFIESNTNPNGPRTAQPDALLEAALYNMVQQNQTRALRLTHELMQVHVTTVNSDEIHRYIIRPSESDYMWNNWYVNLIDFRDMYKVADSLNLSSYKGIALILESWTFSLLTDTYGNVPYFDALKGKDDVYQPKFDRQQDIYQDIYKKLEEANTLLAQGQALTTPARDPLYKGDVNMWRKFGNSLYLRLLLRTAARTELGASTKIKQMVVDAPAQYPLMGSNAESAVLMFTTTPPYVSAFNTFRAFDFSGDNGLSQFFIGTLNKWADPRRTIWANPVGVDNWEGVASGYAPGQVPDRLSTYKDALMNEPRLGNILNYAEVQFMLAEAVAKNYITGDAKAYYDKGVQNAITFWGAAVPATYFDNTEIKWDNTWSLEQKMEKIITQKYFTYFFTDFQAWFEHRRTGYPILPIGPGVQNDKIMPARLYYPTSVQSLNRTNYALAVKDMGVDDLKTKVWWDTN